MTGCLGQVAERRSDRVVVCYNLFLLSFSEASLEALNLKTTNFPRPEHMEL